MDHSFTHHSITQVLALFSNDSHASSYSKSGRTGGISLARRGRPPRPLSADPVVDHGSHQCLLSWLAHRQYTSTTSPSVPSQQQAPGHTSVGSVRVVPHPCLLGVEGIRARRADDAEGQQITPAVPIRAPGPLDRDVAGPIVPRWRRSGSTAVALARGRHDLRTVSKPADGRQSLRNET